MTNRRTDLIMDQVSPSGTHLTVVHFAYPLSDASPAEHRIACMPNMRQSEFGSTPYHPPHLHGNDPRGATCPACKRTEVYKRAMDRQNAK